MLTQKHLSDLYASTLTDETIAKYGFESISKEQAETLLGFPVKSGGWLLRFPNSHLFKFKPDKPFEKKQKYLSPQGSSLDLFVTHKASESIGDLNIPYYFVEGEKKAICMEQLGLAAISVPGVWGFKSRGHMNERFPALNVSGRECIIVFDADKYKNSQVLKAQDAFGKTLLELGSKVKIIDLDPSLGKGFDDQALRFKGDGNIDELLPHYDPKDFTPSLQKSDDDTIANIVIQDNQYIPIELEEGQRKRRPPISNFIMKPIATYDTPDGVVRHIILCGKNGTVRPCMITPDNMLGQSFKTFCFGQGDYIWDGDQGQLTNIWKSLFFKNNGQFICEHDHVGWVEEHKLWLFNNIALGNGGLEYTPDDSGVFWLADRGIKPIPISLGEDGSAGVPYINKDKTAFDLKEYRQRMGETVGDDMIANIGIGWVTAVFYMPEIFKKYSFFPFLFLFGLRQSGKTHIAKWLLRLTGVDGEAKQSESTIVSIQRYLSYFSCLPIFIDEYRNSSKMSYKNTFLRSVYNHQSVGKGTKEGFKVKEVKIRGTVILGGEETPDDSALSSRCIILFLDKRKRKVNHFDWFEPRTTEFSAHAYNILKNKNTDLFLNIMEEQRQHLIANGIPERTAMNYSIVSAGYSLAFGADAPDFSDYVKTMATAKTEEDEREEALSVFFSDIQAILTRKQFDPRAYWVFDLQEQADIPAWKDEHTKTLLYIYFEGIYNIWAEDYRRRKGEPPFKKGSIREYLKSLPGYLVSEKQKRVDKINQRTMMFDYSLTPCALQECFSQEAVANIGATQKTDATHGATL